MYMVFIERSGNDMKTLKPSAIKIKCCYCEDKATCSRRTRKEQYEKSGLLTYCTLTPNRLLTKSKKKKSNSLASKVKRGHKNIFSNKRV